MTLINALHEHIRAEYRSFYADTSALMSFLRGVGLFGFAAVANYFAGRYATEHAGPPIHDFILSNLPRIDTGFIHIQGSGLIGMCAILLSVIFPTRAAALYKSLGLLILTRAVFINMTNLGIYPDAVLPHGSFVTFGGDLFFSGHVANMFLLALLFWDVRFVRILCLGSAIVLGVSALLGHFHYSIDVFSAPFIAYGIYSLSKIFFKKDFRQVLSSYSGALSS